MTINTKFRLYVFFFLLECRIAVGQQHMSDLFFLSNDVKSRNCVCACVCVCVRERESEREKEREKDVKNQGVKKIERKKRVSWRE